MDPEVITPAQPEQVQGQEQVVEPNAQPQTPEGDPLDTITSIDELRNEAKKFRSISQRRGKEKKVEPEFVAPQPINNEYIKRSDLERIATREALKIVGGDIAAEYAELSKIPLGGYDPLDSQSIAANLKERYAILKTRTTTVSKEDPTAVLKETVVVAGTGAGTPPKVEDAPKGKALNLKSPSTPLNWYTKKEGA